MTKLKLVIKSNLFFLENDVFITGFSLQEAWSSMIVLDPDPDPDPAGQIVTDPDPDR